MCATCAQSILVWMSHCNALAKEQQFFCGTTSTNCNILNFLKDRYACGATVLVTLHHSLENYKRDGITLAGNLHFLMAFIIEYVPWTATLIRHPYIEPNPEEIDQDKLDRLRQFPLLKEWHNNLFDGAKKIEWRPYSRLLGDFMLPPYNQQVHLELALTPILCMEKLKHDGGDKNKHLGGLGPDWPHKHSKFVRAWDHRRDYLYTDTESPAIQEMKQRERSNEHFADLGRKTCTYSDHAENLVKLKDNANAIQALNNTGFKNILQLTRPSKQISPLLTVVAKRYSYEEGASDLERETSSRFSECLGLDGTLQCLSKGATIPLKKLWDYIVKLQHIAVLERQVSEHYVREVVLYLISYVVLPNGCDSVSANYMVFLKDISEIRGYAWGEAMLVTLYRSLENYKRDGIALVGNLHFLTAFIKMYVRWTATLIRHPYIEPNLEEINQIS
ncbi:hypothetical protein COLO4_00098 [Corchorus olitorius]|uniref:Aminotransferase-like plant mobile domain-containing protein n=1 Tax=Corchorus olitorius TaxID=93759 RepID=A0A1R3L4S3_9ROSI|nr:hypothetical protein COLO4_00098 [Corchorus olitorius]